MMKYSMSVVSAAIHSKSGRIALNEMLLRSAGWGYHDKVCVGVKSDAEARMNEKVFGDGVSADDVSGTG